MPKSRYGSPLASTLSVIDQRVLIDKNRNPGAILDLTESHYQMIKEKNMHMNMYEMIWLWKHAIDWNVDWLYGINRTIIFELYKYRYIYFRSVMCGFHSLSGGSYNSPTFFRQVGLEYDSTLLCSFDNHSRYQGRAMPWLSHLSLGLICILLSFCVEPTFCLVVQLWCNMSVVSYLDCMVKLYFCLKN